MPEADLLAAIKRGDLGAVETIIPVANGGQDEKTKKEKRALFTDAVRAAGVEAGDPISAYLRKASKGYRDLKAVAEAARFGDSTTNNGGRKRKTRKGKKTRKSKKSKKSRKSRRV